MANTIRRTFTYAGRVSWPWPSDKVLYELNENDYLTFMSILHSKNQTLRPGSFITKPEIVTHITPEKYDDLTKMSIKHSKYEKYEK